jgi:hypothetical protein
LASIKTFSREGGGAYMGGSFDGVLVREGNFSWEGEPYFSALIKNFQKSNIKQQFFSTESKEQHPKLKHSETITYMWGLPPSQYIALYAKVFSEFVKTLFF